MKYKTFLLIFACITYLLSLPAFSKCTKEDVEFYLEKGFNQDQITQLCATSEEANVPDYKPYQQQIVIYSEGEGPGNKGGFSKEEREAIAILKKGTEIYNLNVDSEKIYFTRRVCLVTGNDQSIDNRFRDCPRVDFIIRRQNLLVESSGKTFAVFGKGTVTLKGDIDPQLQGSFDEYPVQVREGLQRNFDWKQGKKKTDIPVRGDFSITAVANAFRALSQVAQAEVVPGTSRLDKKTAEEPVQEARVEEKKKRWWNPFD